MLLLAPMLLALTLSAAAPQFTFEAPPDCTSRAEFDQRMELARAPTPTLGGVSISLGPDTSYHLRLAFSDGTERLLAAESCAELVEAAVLMLSLRQRESPAPLPVPAAPASKPRGGSSTLHQVAVGAATAGWVGVLPQVAPGLELHLGWVTPATRLLVSFARTASTRVDDAEPATVEVSAWAVRPLACWTSSPEPPNLQWGGCGSVRLAWLMAQTQGLADSRNVTAHTLTVSVGPVVRWQWARHLHLFGQASVGLSPWRARFEVVGLGTVFTAPLVSGELSVGMEISWP